MLHKILIGTASWQDKEFVRDWYPPGLSARELLPWYSAHFNFVEVNSSFYGIPKQKSVQTWCEQTPEDFVFDVKLHKILSRHSAGPEMLPPDLRNKARLWRGKIDLTPELEEAVAERFLSEIAPLRESGKLGALLLQLSPAFSPREHQLDELNHLLHVLRDHPVAIELRNRNWMTGEQREVTTAWFRKRCVPLVMVDAPAAEHFTIMPRFDVVTSPVLAYLRLHGRDEHAYTTGKTVAARFDYDYSEEELDEVAQRVEVLTEQVQQVHVVFNNNRSRYAPKAAERLRQVLKV